MGDGESKVEEWWELLMGSTWSHSNWAWAGTSKHWNPKRKLSPSNLLPVSSQEFHQTHEGSLGKTTTQRNKKLWNFLWRLKSGHSGLRGGKKDLEPHPHTSPSPPPSPPLYSLLSTPPPLPLWRTKSKTVSHPFQMQSVVRTAEAGNVCESKNWLERINNPD